MVTRKNFQILSMKIAIRFERFAIILLPIVKSYFGSFFIYFLLQLTATCQVHPESYLPQKKKVRHDRCNLDKWTAHSK